MRLRALGFVAFLFASFIALACEDESDAADAAVDSGGGDAKGEVAVVADGGASDAGTSDSD